MTTRNFLLTQKDCIARAVSDKSTVLESNVKSCFSRKGFFPGSVSVFDPTNPLRPGRNVTVDVSTKNASTNRIPLTQVSRSLLIVAGEPQSRDH